MELKISAQPVVKGNAKGSLVVSQQPFSFFGGFDFNSGLVVDPRSDVYQKNLKNKIFAYPGGKGSSSTAGVILEALKQGVAPQAIINVDAEKILAVGAIVAEVIFNWSIPIISVSKEDFARLTTGKQVEIRDGEIVIN